jgi:iron-sulfur cluster assembly accessory protein
MDSALTPFRLTDRAAARIAEIAAAQGEGALRVAVLAGGCSGFQYKFDLDRVAAPDDVVLERDGARVFIDPASLDLLAGAELDYTDALMGSYFAVRNPNATSSCGCGTSFSID